ncbi:hypothetical protein EG329_014399 [Mollisiaceae sp. DMI_Dod_QoI]|nr:hypothetical protein EG329_014399 [Helotiales sp. DMI_Dod_QoI]
MFTEPGLDVLWIYKYFHIQFCTQTIKADLPGLQPCLTTCQDTPSKSHASQEEPAPPRLQNTPKPMSCNTSLASLHTYLLVRFEESWESGWLFLAARQSRYHDATDRIAQNLLENIQGNLQSLITTARRPYHGYKTWSMLGDLRSLRLQATSN